MRRNGTAPCGRLSKFVLSSSSFAWTTYLTSNHSCTVAESILLYKRGGGSKYVKSQRKPKDEEEGSEDSQAIEKPGDRQDKKEDSNAIKKTESVFTWRHLTYKVQSAGKTITLLEGKFSFHLISFIDLLIGDYLFIDVEGFCKPGTLTALMGSSGAGKSTLLDCLAKRKDDGELTGQVLVNGEQLPVSFQRTTG